MFLSHIFVTGFLRLFPNKLSTVFLQYAQQDFTNQLLPPAVLPGKRHSQHTRARTPSHHTWRSYASRQTRDSRVEDSNKYGLTAHPCQIKDSLLTCDRETFVNS
ncbi:hypothetical protein E2C01_028305 [Portunus trituberculatus]|uniref:Uncharacterized protein n=1 Tax=Portunus trituberculatus TaxID=210409 RepID=A0A5B7EL08_PORTR|nr:hypothetical protein [Portunus trituberculatus]